MQPPSGILLNITALGRWYSMLIMLMAENFAYRHKKTRFNAIIVFLEPLALVSIMSILSSLFNKGAPYGESGILFYASGILPYSVFMHVSLRTRFIYAPRRLPRVTFFDLATAHILDELLLKSMVIALIFAILYFFRGVDEANPVAPGQCLVALMVFAAFGLGMGMTNIGIYAIFPVWRFAYPYVVRALLLFSGVAWVMDFVPLTIREYIVIDPVAHAVTWFRAGLYPNYPTALLDLPYMFECCAALILLGTVVSVITKEMRSAK